MIWRRPLRELIWPWFPLACLLLSAAIVLTSFAIGSTKSDRAQIEDTIGAFAAAVGDHRGEDACARLSPEGQAAITLPVGTLSCAEVVRSFGAGVNAATLQSATIRRLQIGGDLARIPPGGLVGPDGRPVLGGITLRRVDDAWRIASFR